MSHLKNKSEINFNSATLLNDRGQYPSVPHCSYYSCVQLMRHIWITSLKRKLSDIGQIKRNSSHNIGSHEVLINEIGSFLKIRKQDARTFNNKISELKRARNKADYENIEVTYTLSSGSIILAREINDILRKAI